MSNQAHRIKERFRRRGVNLNTVQVLDLALVLARDPSLKKDLRDLDIEASKLRAMARNREFERAYR